VCLGAAGEAEAVEALALHVHDPARALFQLHRIPAERRRGAPVRTIKAALALYCRCMYQHFCL
jgi:hypothetical protein